MPYDHPATVRAATRAQAARAPQRFAGLHLAGANANKTALVTLEGDLVHGPVNIQKVYEKIGSFGTLFSDERLIDILDREGPFAGVFVDCPLSLPPCVACQRPSCPGAIQCDDVSVAYMLALASRQGRRGGGRKARPVNPQHHRLWDLLEREADGPAAGAREPSYSANLAPLVARALTLQRRLNARPAGIVLKETMVGAALTELRPALGLAPRTRAAYRAFEDGMATREAIMERFVERGFVAEGSRATLSPDAIASSLETFEAFIAAFVAALTSAGLATQRPTSYLAHEGFVHLPRLSMPLDHPRPRFE
jgi:hypothetical protein